MRSRRPHSLSDPGLPLHLSLFPCPSFFPSPVSSLCPAYCFFCLSSPFGSLFPLILLIFSNPTRFPPPSLSSVTSVDGNGLPDPELVNEKF